MSYMYAVISYKHIQTLKHIETLFLIWKIFTMLCTCIYKYIDSTYTYIHVRCTHDDGNIYIEYIPVRTYIYMYRYVTENVGHLCPRCVPRVSPFNE